MARLSKLTDPRAPSQSSRFPKHPAARQCEDRRKHLWFSHDQSPGGCGPGPADVRIDVKTYGSHTTRGRSADVTLVVWCVMLSYG